jgi:anti-sigma B factor antagonist
MKFSLDKRERFCILQLEEEKLLSNYSPNLKSEMLGLQRDGLKM